MYPYVFCQTEDGKHVDEPLDAAVAIYHGRTYRTAKVRTDLNAFETKLVTNDIQGR